MRTKMKKWPFPDSLDAVISAPESHKVLLENEKVRVSEVVILPKHREPQHTHKWPSVMIVDKPAKIIYYDERGSRREISRDSNVEFPIIEWMVPEKPHSVENVDITPYHAIRIEVKK